MQDYWLDDAYEPLGENGNFVPYKMFSAYIDSPPSAEPLTDLESAAVHMFELRLLLDLEIEDMISSPPEMSDLGQYVVISTLRHMSIHAHKFVRVLNDFNVQLGATQEMRVAHLGNIEKRIRHTINALPDLRNSVPRLKIDTQEMYTGEGQMRENSFLTCANMINMFIDGITHALPDVFQTALAKVTVNNTKIELDNPRSLPNAIERQKKETSIHCLNIAGMGTSVLPQIAELIRLHWGLSIAINKYLHVAKFYAEGHEAPELWNRTQGLKMSHYLRHVVMELAAFLDIYPTIKEADGGGTADDDAIVDLLAHGNAIRDLWRHIAHWDAGARHEDFASALYAKIEVGKLLPMAAGIAEWARVNAIHYQTRCPDSPQVPDVPQVIREIDPEIAEREVSLARVRAQNALERAQSGAACPTIPS